MKREPVAVIVRTVRTDAIAALWVDTARRIYRMDAKGDS